ncbi:hypothetical protein HK104_001372 [Borealophlyctis nickersoniae]|nr:hypothetical protein HK104_001372 [Borealophlyctis nickersoniae]
MAAGNGVPCKFFRLGTCQKGSRCPFSHDKDAGELVCTFFLKGQCRYGSSCALPHVRPTSSSSASYKPPSGLSSTPRAPVSVQVGSGSTYADYANKVLAARKAKQQQSVDELSGQVERLGLEETTDASPVHPSSSSHSGFRSDVPWPSDLPPEFSTSDPESSDSETETPQRQAPRSTYSTAIRQNVSDTDPQAASVVVVQQSSSGAKAANGGTQLCPFAMQGNCKYGDKCRYVHGLQCPSCFRYCLHPAASPAEHQEHVDSCMSKRQQTDEHNARVQDSADMECVVCMERVMGKRDPRFGLLNCEHCVCLECIRTWRTNERMDTSKVTCPICREVTHFVTPSVVWVVDPEAKAQVVEEYKAKLGSIPCKHYNYGDGTCPFGTSCFYQHVGRDGVPEEVKLRVVKDDEEGVKIVSTVRLADFLDAWEEQRQD